MQSQEIYFSQYWLTPTALNPGLTGQFKGSYRGSGVARTQDRGIYNMLGLTVDAPIIRGLRKQDWVGVGIHLGSSNDGNAAVRFKRNVYGLNAAYHIGLDKKQTRIFSIGVQGMTDGYSINTMGGDLTNTQLLGLNGNLLAKYFNGNADDPSGSDLQVGMVYNQRGKESDFKIGVAVDGILSPNINYGSDTTGMVTKGLGINGFTSIAHAVNKQLSFVHGLAYHSQGQFNKININSRAYYRVNKESDLQLVGGLGFRLVRAPIIYAGLQKGNLDVGLAIDLDIIDSNKIDGGLGAIELGARYTGILSKRPSPKPVMYCPRI